MALVGFVCEVPRPFGGIDKFKAWATPRCRTFHVVADGPIVRLAGVLLRPPDSQKQFQRLWATNLKNWKLPRFSYRRGAVRLVTRAQYRAEFGLSENDRAVCAQVVQNLVDIVVDQDDRRVEQREAAARRAEAMRYNAWSRTPEGKAQLEAEHRARVEKEEADWKAYLERTNAEMKVRKEERDTLKRERAAMEVADSEASDLRRSHVRPRAG